MTDFWQAVDAQIAELGTAKDADDVVNILNAYGSPSSGDAFFGGSGGDATVWGALYQAGWSVVWMDADYFWCMRSTTGSKVTYVEGDIYKGDSRTPAEAV